MVTLYSPDIDDKTHAKIKILAMSKGMKVGEFTRWIIKEYCQETPLPNTKELIRLIQNT